MTRRYLLIFFVILLASLEVQSQVPFWLRNANGPGNDEIFDIVKSQEDYYVTGYYSNVTHFDAVTLNPQQGGEAFVAKVDQNGNFLWAKRIGGTYTERGIAIDVMPNGNVIVTGHFVGSISIENVGLTSLGDAQDIFVACFSPTGAVLWAKRIGGLGIDIVSDVMCDTASNVLVTGQFVGRLILGTDSLESGINPLDGDYSYDIFITKMNSSGGYVWSKHAITKKHDRSGKIAIGADNSVFVSGNFTDTLTLGNTYQNNSLNMGFIVHYAANGDHLWFRRVQSSVTEITDIACTDSLLYMTGSYSGIQRFANDETVGSWQNVSPNSYGNKYYVAAYNYQGILQFTKTEGSSSSVKPKAICPIPGGGFFLAGEFECQHSQYQAAYGTGVFISRGFKDLFISEYSASNSRVWAKQIGSTGVDEIGSMVINSFGKPVFAGSFTNSIASPARSSWGTKPWYAYFNDEYTINYCGDPEYNFYAVLNSQGSKDMLIANIADTTRSTLDIFNRTAGDDCDLSPTYGSLESYSPGSCQNLRARALFSTGPSNINGINYTFEWNGNPSGTNSYAPTMSGNVIGTVIGANTCYEFTDNILIDLYPVIPQPLELTIEGGNFVTFFPAVNGCTTFLYANPDSVTTITGVMPSTAFNYSWELPNNSIQPSNELVITANSATGTYEYIITEPLSGCSESVCFNLGFPDTTTSGGGGTGGIDTLVLKFRQGSRLLEEGDTLFGCVHDILELTLVDASDTANITELFVSTPASWSCLNGNTSVVSPGISTIDFHTKSIELLSDTIEDGMQMIGISFGYANGQNEIYGFSQQFVIHVYPQPTFQYSLTGDFQSICPDDTARFIIDTELDFDLTWDSLINTVTAADPFSFYTVFPQNYLVTFYDTTDMGCIAQKSENFNMSFFQAPPISLNPSQGIVCNDEYVTLTVPGATEVLWVGPSGDTLSTQLEYNTNIAGQYFAKIVDINGCDLITNTTNVRNRSSFGYELSPLSICPGETATISLFALEGDNISWLPPFSGSGLTQIATLPGLYRFTAPLCGIIDTFDVIVPGPPVSAEIDSVGTSMCPGDTIILSSVNFVGVDLMWYNVFSDDPEVEITEPGTYILELIDENACATYDTISIIELPAPSPPVIPAYSYYCGVDSIHLNSPSGDSIVWFLGNDEVAFAPDFNYYQFNFDSTVYIANHSNETGCNSQLIEYPVDARKYLNTSLADSIFTQLFNHGHLLVNFPYIQLPDSSSNEPDSHGWVQYSIQTRADINPGTTIHNTAAIYFDFNEPVITNDAIIDFCNSVVTGYNYGICEGDSVLINSVWYNSPGEYNLVLSNIFGCDSTIKSTVSFLNSGSQQTINICAGDSAQIGDNWYTLPGNYQTHFATSTGCDSLVNTTIEFISLNISAELTDNIITASGGIIYQWYDCQINEAIEGATDSSFTATQTGIFKAWVTNTNGCSAFTECFEILITGIDQATESGFKIYPNPASDQVTVELNSSVSENASIIIIDAVGRIIFLDNFNLNPGKNKMPVNVNQFSAGVYSIALNSNSIKYRGLFFRK